MSRLTTFLSALKKNPASRALWANLHRVLAILRWNSVTIDDQLSVIDKIEKKFRSKSVSVEISLLKFKLAIGETHAFVEMTEAIKTLRSVTDLKINRSDSDGEKISSRPTIPGKIVALLHFGRSGTGLLHSLIDSHSKISTLPSVYFSEYFDASTWSRIKHSDWKEMVDRFILTYPVLFDARASEPIAVRGFKRIANIGQSEGMTTLGENRNEVCLVDKEHFRQQMHDLMRNYEELDALTFFKLIHIAYDRVVGDINKKEILFYHIHNPDTYAKLNFLGSAPEASLLTLVREPIQCIESWLKIPFKQHDYKTMAFRIIQILFQVDDAMYYNRNSVGMRLEDLKLQPKKTMRTLCNWIGMAEEETLYKMTAQGKKWWGDHSSHDLYSANTTPFDKSSIGRKVGKIFSENDQFVLRTLFYPFSARFNYAKENQSKFENDLQRVRPMLNNLFDFEKNILSKTKVNEVQFRKSFSYQYLRAGMINRYSILSESKTYPNMLKPLVIDN